MPLPTLVALAALAGIAGVLVAMALRAAPPAADQAAVLAHAKTNALMLLAIMGLALVLSLTMPPGLFADGLRTTSEAAIVGGLADWFAVSALFRPLPVPVIGRDTDVIARKKDEIGDQLAAFVQEKFLDPDSLAALIRRQDLAAGLAAWLTQEENTRRLGGFLVKMVAGWLQLVEEARVQQLMKDAARTLLARIDLSRGAAAVLDTLTEGGRHQQLLDQVIGTALRLLAAPRTRAALADKIVEWLRTEHYKKQLVLPTEWLGEKGSELIARELGRYLDEVRRDPAHGVRTVFDAQVALLIERLKRDPVLRARTEEIKAWLLNDEDLGRYASQLWGTYSRWLHRSVRNEDSALHRNLVAAGGWLGRELAADPDLRATLNAQIEAAALSAAPEFSEYLTTHIRDTVRQWDAREMATQIELSIGPQLQKIRVNGTIVGGAIGLVLFAAGETVRRLSW
jgi:uncharacterized membrane-anchored protein YjiN (DUF445 family)